MEAHAEKSSFRDFGLDESLVEACEKMGLVTPTPIQGDILAQLQRKKDIVAVSGTGTGKTVAYALPILHHLLKDDKYFYALVLLPTRELAQQVHAVFAELGKEVGLRTSLLIGGVDVVIQGKMLASRPHVIIGTPGRVAHHLKNTKGITLETFRYLVLDECDRLLDGDFEGEVKEVLGLLGDKKNTFLITATITKRVLQLKEKLLLKPLHFETLSSETISPNLLQNYAYLPNRHKEVYLYEIVRKLGISKAIIFVSTCLGSEKLEKLLTALGETVCVIHGGKPQGERTAIIEGFRAGSKNILIATDVVARGIDIPHTKLILNYDLPETHKDYIHRVGRTARAGQSGRSITFVTQYDVQDFQRLEARISTRMEEYKIDPQAIQELIDTVSAAKRETDAAVKEEGLGQKLKDLKARKKNPRHGAKSFGGKKGSGSASKKHSRV
ncbi:ATP-dependent RNA helicase DDX47/RRP3 [Nematocida displodere]|uniref:ATP-dependent RNA helicase DDX47/RRP3 n=1 Tax=Nematocida displodere TaxID=1805483 RepID=A0A177EDJ0_9MICR|nr:ATP-dependent RNA helicase DDX47/RRP3 [Nematocida displodere]